MHEIESNEHHVKLKWIFYLIYFSIITSISTLYGLPSVWGNCRRAVATETPKVS